LYFYDILKNAIFKTYMIQRAVLLAGGRGTRLYPATKITNKHLLPVYNKPMIFYPLETLKKMGITDILVICGDEHTGGFAKLLGSGSEYGVRFTFRVQEGSGGIADALSLAEDFAGGENIAVILGDNIFSEDFSSFAEKFCTGAQLFGKRVSDPGRFGVAEVHNGKVISVEEKPKNPKSDMAITGLYFFDGSVFEKIKKCSPSSRNELEITDVHRMFLSEGKLKICEINGSWTDAGTHESFFEASRIARNIELA
jgi:glucose-1-phosphate thymidylyltransferase